MNCLYNHFRKSGHNFKDVSVQIVEHIIYDNDATSSFKSKSRFIAELNWLKNLQPPFPLGLNDNIYQKVCIVTVSSTEAKNKIILGQSKS